MAEKRLDALLAAIQPELDSEEWAFACVDATFPVALAKPLLVFHEREGATIVAPAAELARFNVSYEGTWRRIVINAYSALDAVGFLAEMTRALTAENIPANVVSAYHHDHLFVPSDRAQDALTALAALAERGA